MPAPRTEHPIGHQHGTCHACAATLDNVEELYVALKWFADVLGDSGGEAQRAALANARRALARATELHDWL